MHKHSIPTVSYEDVKKLFYSRDQERTSSDTMTNGSSESEPPPPSRPPPQRHSYSMDEYVPEMLSSIPKRQITPSEIKDEQIVASPETASSSGNSYESSRRGENDNFVKFESETSSFEDIRSVAAKSWGNGIDIRLKKNDKKAKKSDWLSQNDFFGTSNSESDNKSNEDKSTTTSNQSIKNETPNKDETSIPPPTVFDNTSHQKKGYADSVKDNIDRNVPSWAPDPDHIEQPSILPKLNNTTLRKFVIPPENTQTVNHMVPVLAVNSKETELFRLLDYIVTLQDNSSAINTFYKRADTILRGVHKYSGRIFSSLLQALILIMELEANIPSSRSIAAKIMPFWNQFRTGCLTYIQFYIRVSRDFLVLLKFLAILSISFPVHAHEFQLPLLDHVLESLKKVSTPAEIKEMEKFFQQIRNPRSPIQNPMETEKPIPPLPSASLIVHETQKSRNSLFDYESKHDTKLVNVLQRSDSTPDLYRYLILHYMLLREEMMGPLRETVKYIQGIDTNDPIPKDNIFGKALPKGTLLTMSSTQASILFELSSIYNEDTLMEYLTEGTLAFLLPEDNNKNPDNRFDGAFIGHVVRFSTAKKGDSYTRVVAIQSLESETRINWKGSYTLAVYKANASIYLSVLRWLYGAVIDFNKENFSSILTPRLIAADNVLTKTQIHEWCRSQLEPDQILINESQVPSYMHDVEIDISCVLVRNKSFIAIPSKNIWPRHNSKWESVSPSRRQPIYTLSPSQVAALKFALTHRIAVISGPAGTGKTFLASKLIQLISATLHKGQFRQPVLLITKSQSGLDSILTQIVPHMPDVLRFGGHPWDDCLVKKQAIKYTASSTTDPNRKHQQCMERNLLNIQVRLNALFTFRSQVTSHDPNVFCNVIAPSYADVMREGYMKGFTKVAYTVTNHLLWKKWVSSLHMDKNPGSGKAEIDNAQWKLINDHQARTGTGLMPIMDEQTYQARYNWVEAHSTTVLPIPEATQWPFPNSSRSGVDLRSELLECWRMSVLENIWHISDEEKQKIIQALTNVLLDYIDTEINDLMDEQTKESVGMNDTFIQKCVYYGRFNRVVGMTADFAAVHHDWISKLWPCVVIVDEASQILESVVMSSLLGPRVEHVVIFGNSDSSYRPNTINEEIAGPPRNLGASLFERWKVSGGKMIRLEEQWRMHSELASVIDNFSGTKNDKELLITAPLTTGINNKMDGRDNSKEVLYGISQRVYYVEYQTDRSEPGINQQYSTYLNTTFTNAEIDEARYIAHLAVYMTQQPYSVPQVTVLTLTVQQKYIIRKILRDEIPQRTCFNENVPSIVIDSVEQNAGRENSFVIISTATPGKTNSYANTVPFALTRARYGLMIVGKPKTDKVHARWTDLAEYMKKRELYGSCLQLTCNTHAESAMMGHWSDFMQMKNGGCSQPCLSLMSCGHVCPEVCHFFKHDQVTCKELCIRPRPSNCTHLCIKKCFECSKVGNCPPCTEITTMRLPCKHTHTAVCSSVQNLESILCHELVDTVLSCGHTKTVECYRTAHPEKIECEVSNKVTLPCGHVAESKCGVTPICIEQCTDELECGHPCRKMCGAPHNHDRRNCTAGCPKQLICGHYCAKGCAKPDEHTERCLEKCRYVCSHGYACTRECWKDCIKCVSQCPYKCDHFKCTKQCNEKCDRPPCNVPCKKSLYCGHKCAGLCGEPCPPCRVCDGDLQCLITLRHLREFEQDERLYVLPQCGCVFSVEALDQYFDTQVMNGKHTAIRLWGCPSCGNTIYTALRYNNYIKTEIALVNTIKQKMEKERQKLTYHEKNQIIAAMNEEVSFSVHNVVGGRWFVCENQHPYYIGDCGGATEVSQCPECGSTIGGLQHKVVETNRFYGEFDGSDRPAWPGQPEQSNNQTKHISDLQN